MLLQGKVVAITGGFGALGRGVARVLLTYGARPVLFGRSAGFASSFPADVLQVERVDLENPLDAEAALERVVAQQGGLDAIVNVAGGFQWETIEHGSVETWDLMYRSNLRTAIVSVKAALPHLRHRGGGRIINIGSASARRGEKGFAAYAASKSGVERLTEALADELLDDGITVNAILPGIIDTPANRAAMPDADFARWVSTESLGEMIAFLLSPQASAVTGALIPVVNRTR